MESVGQSKGISFHLGTQVLLLGPIQELHPKMHLKFRALHVHLCTLLLNRQRHLSEQGGATGRGADSKILEVTCQ